MKAPRSWPISYSIIQMSASILSLPQYTAHTTHTLTHADSRTHASYIHFEVHHQSSMHAPQSWGNWSRRDKDGHKRGGATCSHRRGIRSLPCLLLFFEFLTGAQLNLGCVRLPFTERHDADRVFKGKSTVYTNNHCGR